MLDKGIIHILGGMKWDGMRFHHVMQNDMQFKAYELFVFGIFHLILLVSRWPQVTETGESETIDKEGTTLSSNYLKDDQRPAALASHGSL